MRCAVAASLACGASGSGPFPVVGILAAPATSEVKSCGGKCEYVAASYVKFLEAAGARAVPISYYSSNDEIDAAMKELNGILFPGGAADIPPAAQRIVDNAFAEAGKGGYFPLWGTCLGFEWLVQAVGGKPALQHGFDAENITLPLAFTHAAEKSRLYGDGELRHVLTKYPVTMNNHEDGIEPKHLASNTRLAATFDVLSTNWDKQGRQFVSSMEAKNAPVYGVQYHPEKNTFEWGTNEDGSPYEVIQHSPEAVSVEQKLANFFVAEARKNENVYDLSRSESFFEGRISDVSMAPSFVEVYHLFPRADVVV